MCLHSINDAFTGMGESKQPQNVNCRTCDRGDSNFDVRHTVTLNTVYELPFGAGRRYLTSGPAEKILGGWQVSGLAAARTGLPVPISSKRSSKDMIDTNTKNQRPDLVYSVDPIPAAGQTVNQWLNPAAYAVPRKYHWGTLGRNNLRGPGFFQVDLGLSKRFPVTERTNFEFRAEAFNIANHPNFAVPNSEITQTALFGRITQILNTNATGSGTARQIQFMLRFNF
jgi:hypothetical protein